MDGEKVFLITGASAGIGVGIAKSLSSAGAKRLALVARRRELLQQVAEECKQLGAKEVLVLQKDLSDLEGACLQVVKETIKEFGRKHNFRHKRARWLHVVFTQALTS